MNHEFYFSRLSENPAYDYNFYHETAADILIHDSLIMYVHDSLQLVPSYNPAFKMKPQRGLNYYARTVLKRHGALNLLEISRAWSALFKRAPKDLQLTGGFSWVEEDGAEEGEYEKLTFDRDEVIASFDLLTNLCSMVSDSTGSAFLMHHGV